MPEQIETTPQSPDQMEALSSAHAASLARYDALNMLRNAATIANAAFAKALAEALEGNVAGARDGLAGGNAVLAAANAFWRAVDTGSAYEGEPVAALIDAIGGEAGAVD